MNDFHLELGRRFASKLPPKAKELFDQWGIELRGIRQQDSEQQETTAIVLELPSTEQMERFNEEWGERIFDLFSYLSQQKTLVIDAVFIKAPDCDTCYTWMVKTGYRFPVPTQCTSSRRIAAKPSLKSKSAAAAADYQEKLNMTHDEKLEYLKQLHEPWLGQLEGLAIQAIASANWTPVLEHLNEIMTWQDSQLHEAQKASTKSLSRSGADLLSQTDQTIKD
jgi:hypothetical protein